MWLLGPHKHGPYLHILKKQGSIGSDNDVQPWDGITGRVKVFMKQEVKRLMSQNAVAFENVRNEQTRMETKLQGVETKLQAIKDKMETDRQGLESKLDRIT